MLSLINDPLFFRKCNTISILPLYYEKKNARMQQAALTEIITALSLQSEHFREWTTVDLHSTFAKFHFELAF